jgi:nucleoside 2-deoxyribosyltransferase
MARVYCAGPFFNDEERGTMFKICNALESAGHETYLAQRDGLEAGTLQNLLSERLGNKAEAKGLLHRLVFSMDIYRLLDWAEAVVANLNGRVPDEGTVVECALAWYAGKPLVYFKNDWRAPFDGRDNLMLSCLVEGTYQDSLSSMLERTAIVLGEAKTSKSAREIALGRRLFTSIKSEVSITDSVVSEWLKDIGETEWDLEKC